MLVETGYAHHHRQGLGLPRRLGGRGRPDADLHRPAPRPRGDLAAGVRRPPCARAAPAPPGPDVRDGRSQHPDHATRRADRRRGGGAAGGAARGELRGVRRPVRRPRASVAGNRPRHRPGTRPDAAGHDDRLRRQPHGDARRVRRARVRHRHERGRDGARHAVPAPAASEDAADRRRGTPGRRRVRQGPDSRHHRPHRRGWRHRPRHRVRGRGRARADDGTADDAVQHVDRGGRPRRPRRPRRGHLQLPGRAALVALRAGVGRRGRRVADAAHRRGRRLRSAASRSTARRSAR